MKTMKKTMTLVAVLLVAVVLLTGCSGGGGAAKIEGNTWKLTMDAGSYYLMSFSDGICTQNYVNLITGVNDTETMPYTINGNKLTVDTEEMEWKISGTTLQLMAHGVTMTLEKQ